MAVQGKFGRNYILRVVTPENTLIRIEPPFSIEFEVVRNTLASANTASITLYNLGPSNRSLLFKDRFSFDQVFALSLFAGYGGALHEVFRGNILQAYSYRNQTEWITELDCLDGLDAIQNGAINQSFSGGTSFADMIRGVVGEMPNLITQFLGGPAEGTATRGQTFSAKGIDAIAEITNNQYFIDNQGLFVLGRNELIPDVETRLDPSNLLQTPRRRRQLLEVLTLFEPVIRVGQRYDITSLEPIYNGTYKVVGFSHNVVISEARGGQAQTMIQLDSGTRLLRAPEGL